MREAARTRVNRARVMTVLEWSGDSVLAQDHGKKKTGQGKESVPKPYPGYQQTPRVAIGERVVIVIAIDMIWLWELWEIPQGHL